MPKYYCDYCKSYLTHDKMSVRKSHLSGRNHIKFYCSYYEEKAKQLGIWDSSESKYQIDLEYLTSQEPSPDNFAREVVREREKSTVRRTDDMAEEVCLPPPPNLSKLAPPPPSVLRLTAEHSHLISVNMARQEYRF
ncbi:zf-U1-domain-containing protein [Metschnikowia bicuspidata var. bicuspidata NRRL YB-4993]|uniref:Zf-U1-domain-containing protein n=1 Tax=Metschnikowia bicuspidata var. bicuspidata NRRL YB-4993 TaxID=869754 RepID=A0A1A0HIM5_9ASCO|nr:zf-U1-domain-containing protein [Metschnikowia bicuspidata var. bicuspidata NRRL YB-4993]OBA23856.1 zf-U1-domain-containing protein [Metschnikowia bicuspidata var. bicuspidata NRRL YB-4993]